MMILYYPCTRWTHGMHTNMPPRIGARDQLKSAHGRRHCGLSNDQQKYSQPGPAMNRRRDEWSNNKRFKAMHMKCWKTSISAFFWFITQYLKEPYKLLFKVHQPSANQPADHLTCTHCIAYVHSQLNDYALSIYVDSFVVAYLYASRESSECTDNVYYTIIILYTEWHKF